MTNKVTRASHQVQVQEKNYTGALKELQDQAGNGFNKRSLRLTTVDGVEVLFIRDNTKGTGWGTGWESLEWGGSNRRSQERKTAFKAFFTGNSELKNLLKNSLQLRNGHKTSPKDRVNLGDLELKQQEVIEPEADPVQPEAVQPEPDPVQPEPEQRKKGTKDDSDLNKPNQEKREKRRSVNDSALRKHKTTDQKLFPKNVIQPLSEKTIKKLKEQDTKGKIESDVRKFFFKEYVNRHPKKQDRQARHNNLVKILHTLPQAKIPELTEGQVAYDYTLKAKKESIAIKFTWQATTEDKKITIKARKILVPIEKLIQPKFLIDSLDIPETYEVTQKPVKQSNSKSVWRKSAGMSKNVMKILTNTQKSPKDETPPQERKKIFLRERSQSTGDITKISSIPLTPRAQNRNYKILKTPEEPEKTVEVITDQKDLSPPSSPRREKITSRENKTKNWPPPKKKKGSEETRSPRPESTEENKVETKKTNKKNPLQRQQESTSLLVQKGAADDNLEGTGTQQLSQTDLEPRVAEIRVAEIPVSYGKKTKKNLFKIKKTPEEKKESRIKKLVTFSQKISDEDEAIIRLNLSALLAFKVPEGGKASLKFLKSKQVVILKVTNTNKEKSVYKINTGTLNQKFNPEDVQAEPKEEKKTNKYMPTISKKKKN